MPWHQDATYFGLYPYEHVTAWIALTNSTLENGCVEVFPGSHNSGQKPYRDDREELAMLSRGQTLSIKLDESAAVPLGLSAGDVSFHHTLLMHRYASNKSRQPRIGIDILYTNPRKTLNKNALVSDISSRGRQVWLFRSRTFAQKRE